jgi:hypothetical protein
VTGAFVRGPEYPQHYHRKRRGGEKNAPNPAGGVDKTGEQGMRFRVYHVREKVHGSPLDYPHLLLKLSR